ncbi:TniQ family protein [Brevibacillus sp. SIMBA_040]|uniref:TniQ family protein n=1 Tax=unclassified Brevibacillus TaxID=2684853 RepID=UPI00397ACE02
MNSYCWRPEWIRPFESPWSVIEKFKYANNVNSREVLKLLGTEHVRKIKATIGQCHRDLATLAGFNEDSLQHILNFNLFSFNEELLQRITSPLPERYKLNKWIRNYLAYCEKCINTGYHSVLHQFKLLDYCPIHMTALLKACIKCNQIIPYHLTDKELSGAYECICGHKFFHPNNHTFFYSTWGQHEPIICEKSIRWLGFKDNKNIKSKHAHLFLEKDLENYPTMFNLLSCLNTKMEVLPSSRTIISTSNIRLIKGKLEKEENKRYSKMESLRVNEMQQQEYRFICMQKDLQKSYHSTISAIARYLRKTILAKHKTCIKRYFKETDNLEKCPFAFAYLHWRCFVQGYNSARHVDETMIGMGHKYLEPKYLQFPNWQDSEYLTALYEEWKKCNGDITIESRASLKWIFNRAISHLVMNRFWGWLQEAPSKMEKYISLGLPKFKYEYLKVFFFVLPTNNGESLEFHWDIEEGKESILNQLNCPFKTVKSKRKRLQDNVINQMDRWLPV